MLCERILTRFYGAFCLRLRSICSLAADPCSIVHVLAKADKGDPQSAKQKDDELKCIEGSFAARWGLGGVEAQVKWRDQATKAFIER
jgi:hypothetical protein